MRLKDWLSVTEAAAKLGISGEYLRALCRQGRVKGAHRIGRAWLIPAGFAYQRQAQGAKPKPSR